MIVVKCNKNEFAYDVHSLVKAFYPAEDVKVFEEGEKSLSSDFNLPELFMYFEENRHKKLVIDNCDLACASFFKTKLKDIDLSTNIISGIIVGYEDIKGAVIDSMQAIDLMGLLGVNIK